VKIQRKLRENREKERKELREENEKNQRVMAELEREREKQVTIYNSNFLRIFSDLM
jgi:hypothetical protein